MNQKIAELKNLYERAVFLENGYEDYIKNAEKFYELTYERDQAFVENLLKKMNDEKADKAALVAGGYHTPNLKALFKANNLSYIVVTPQVYQETNHKRYEKLLLGQKEVDSGQLNVRIRGQKETAIMSRAAFIARIKKEITQRS